MADLLLSKEEIAALCPGIKQKSRQIAHLNSIGLRAWPKPNGQPLVFRLTYESWLNPPPPSAPPHAMAKPPPPIPWEETPLGRAQAQERESRAEEAARSQAFWDAQPKPTRAAVKAAQRQEERRRKEARAALVRFHAARRRVAKLQRTPPWADQAAILAIYQRARALSVQTGVEHHVDHEIPLQGRLVSGLHVPANLQILTGSENSRKRNRYEVIP